MPDPWLTAEQAEAEWWSQTKANQALLLVSELVPASWVQEAWLPEAVELEMHQLPPVQVGAPLFTAVSALVLHIAK